MQQDVFTVNQGDMIILEGKKCGRLHKLKEENSVRGEISRINLEMSSREIELQGRLQRDVNRVKVLREGEMKHSGKAQAMTINPPKVPGRGAIVKGLTILLQPRKELN